MFQFSVCIFLAQFVATDQLTDNTGKPVTHITSACTKREIALNDTEFCETFLYNTPIWTSRLMWLLLETIVFYAYMFSTSAFILYRQCAGTFFPREKSDIKKLIQDFITYAAINLSWFNINFLLCSMPLIVMLILNPLLEKHYDDLHP